MKHIFILSFLLFTSCLTQKGFAQTTLIHPYAGGSINFLGVSHPGWGIDAGVRYSSLYAGLEYGTYGHEVTTVSLPYGETYHPIYEDYYGAHAGVVIEGIAYFGLVFLHSYNYYADGTFSTWFNIGPDVRLQAGPHFMFAVAYTIRRGLNAGINFLF